MTTALDLLGIACLAVAAWFVFGIPGPLALVGVASLAASWKASR